jgi:hypothetical protein
MLWNQKVRTDRTIPNNKPDNMIYDNKQGICELIYVTNPGERNLIKKEAEKILKCEIPHNRNSAHVECESKSDTGNNRGRLEPFQNHSGVPEQHTGKAGN